MNSIDRRFSRISTTYAPGQEARLTTAATVVSELPTHLAGAPVDFSHGNVDANAFEPTPGAFDAFADGVRRGGEQAYTEYRGSIAIRDHVAAKLAAFTGAPLSGADELIVTPGTQGALFLAVASTVAAGDKVAIVLPDYFANRKLVEFLDGEVIPVELDYLGQRPGAGLALQQLEDAFKAGAKVFLFSNPNNPTGAVYSSAEITEIGNLANRYGATVIVDQLYSRMQYAGSDYSHLSASGIAPSNVLTIMGPSKTESLSGYRLGVAFGAAQLIDRMEKLQAIVSLRAPGYCQSVLKTWFSEPEGWMATRIAAHRAIRDDLVTIFRGHPGISVRVPDAGSYLFPRLPALRMELHDFIRLLRLGAGVTVTPGTEFSPNAADSVRLNFSQNHHDAVQAVHRMLAVLKDCMA